MSDNFTETSSESWLGRLGKSIIGVFFGIILVFIAIILLWWNEGNAVKTAKGLKEGQAAIVSVQADHVDAANDKKLIHVSGKAETKEDIDDPVFEISANALRLSRGVQMYQWTEHKDSKTEKKLGGGSETVTTYEYKKEWSDKLVDSSEFKHPENHENPSELIANSDTFEAKEATLGSFELPAAVIEKMPGDESLPVTNKNLKNLPSDLSDLKAKISGGAFYFGADPAKPAVGDQKVTFEILKPGVFTIVARQSGNTFEPYLTKQGTEILLVEAGQVSPELMFQHAETENTIFTWFIRLAGFVLMVIALAMIFAPLQTLADVIPFLGSIVGAGTGLIAFLLGLTLTLFIIALAWLAYRPLFGVLLLIIAAAAVFGIKKIAANRAATAKNKAGI